MRDLSLRARYDEGFTLVELMSVVLILATLVMLAIPQYAQSTRRAEAGTCQGTRATVDRADYAYYLHNGDWAPSIGALVGEWLSRSPACPSDGTYAWIDVPTTEMPARSLGCSVHYFPVEPLSPLGSSFGEISGNMISMLNAYRAKYGKWPRTASPYNYTDLGLNAADWAKPIAHVYYSPSGSKVNIKPETGWDITVKNAKGTSLLLTAKSKLNLIYSGGIWYFGSVHKSNVVDIATLSVVAAKKG